jgi:hypothetical protein
MRSCLILSVLAGLLLAGTGWAEPSVAPVTHRLFQAVNANGEQTYTATQTVVLEGILLHQPGDMLNPTPDDTITATYNLGAQWQFFFQGEGDDHAGTAVFLAQLYDNLPWDTPGGYSNEEFVAELSRLNAARFSPGDRIRVTGWFLSYKGKNNINEQHNKNPDRDFTIELLEPDVGLPTPEVVSLDQLKDDEDRFIFDSERLRGGEYYQGRLIKIEDVNVVDPNAWEPDGMLMVTDGVRTLPVKLGRGNGIYRGSYNLTRPCDVIGILDQDSISLRDGYRLWVVNYDGNGVVLASHEHRVADLRNVPDPNIVARASCP